MKPGNGTLQGKIAGGKGDFPPNGLKKYYMQWVRGSSGLSSNPSWIMDFILYLQSWREKNKPKY